jgi:hypothetical protein
VSGLGFLAHGFSGHGFSPRRMPQTRLKESRASATAEHGQAMFEMPKAPSPVLKSSAAGTAGRWIPACGSNHQRADAGKPAIGSHTFRNDMPTYQY